MPKQIMPEQMPEMVLKNRLTVYPSDMTGLFRKVNEAVARVLQDELTPDRALKDCDRWLNEMERIIEGYRLDVINILMKIKNPNGEKQSKGIFARIFGG